MDKPVTVGPLRRRRRFTWPRWLWWWDTGTDFEIRASRMSGADYEQRLLADCDRAIAAGAADLATGDMFDALIRSDLAVDLCQLHEESSRRLAVLSERKARHERRWARARRRAQHVTEDLRAEEAKRDGIDAALRDRRGGPVMSDPVVSDNGSDAHPAPSGSARIELGYDEKPGDRT